jgi:RNA 2',3'-cyclic 3'-phosphodiesterase
VSQALFPGWRPSEGEAARLGPLVDAVREDARKRDLNLRPRRPDQWHATLCVIGHDVGHLATPMLRDALASAAGHIPPHRFSIERVTYWPQSGVVAALPFDCPPLHALCDATRDAIRRCGISPQQAISQPHVTLAHLDTHLPPQPWLHDVECAATGSFQVDGFELLFNPGGRYESLAHWQLTGNALPRPPELGSLL